MLLTSAGYSTVARDSPIRCGLSFDVPGTVYYVVRRANKSDGLTTASTTTYVRTVYLVCLTF